MTSPPSRRHRTASGRPPDDRTPPSAGSTLGTDDRRPPPVGSNARGDDRDSAAVGPTFSSVPSFRRDGRAVSTTLGYVLALAITSVLVSGLMIAATGFVETEREQVIRSELEVVGQTLIADLGGADRLASAVDGDVRVRSSLPRRVGGSAYTIEIRADPDDGTIDGFTELTLSAASVDVSVDLRVVTSTTLSTTTVDGGELVVVFDGSTLEVREG
jgi:hypothetical protein